jgi:hypothetical protein
MNISIVLAGLVSIISAQAGAVTVYKPASRSGAVEPIRIEGVPAQSFGPADGTHSWAERSARPPAWFSSERDEQENLAESDRALMLAGMAAIGFLLRRRNGY